MLVMSYGGGSFFHYVISFVALVAFSYVVWIMAIKETGSLKTIGKIISIVLIIVALLSFAYKGFYGKGGWCKKGGKDRGMMMHGKGMGKMMEDETEKSDE
ncbi:hypothetical protein KKA47_03515 [bacterium]|nr:hypothetical protein [bacterium]